MVFLRQVHRNTETTTRTRPIADQTSSFVVTSKACDAAQQSADTFSQLLFVSAKITNKLVLRPNNTLLSKQTRSFSLPRSNELCRQRFTDMCSATDFARRIAKLSSSPLACAAVLICLLCVLREIRQECRAPYSLLFITRSQTTSLWIVSNNITTKNNGRT